MFGAELRRLRLAAGVSLTDLARQVHYSKGYLSKIETGDRPANPTVAQQCDAVLGARGALIALVPDDCRAQREPVAESAATDDRGPVPAQLPHDVPGFAGREAELAELEHCVDSMADSGVISTISGAAGIGKTALAIRFGHRVADRFPDGQLYLNLRGFDPSGSPMTVSAALEHLLRGIGPSTEISLWQQFTDLDDRTAIYRSLLAGKRMLLVLDNAVTADQVRPLLPGSPTCFVLITSRERLGGLVARHGARRITLRPLARQAALALLTRVVGVARVAAEPDAAEALIRLCDYLPLALCVAAERVAVRPNSTLTELVGQLAIEQDRLDMLTTSGDEAGSVRMVISWSYRALAAESRRMFRLLGVTPRPDIDTPAAAALADVSVPEARRLLDTLADMHLLERTGHDDYQLHDLLHAYAAERVSVEDPATVHRDALRRVLAWYRRMIQVDCALMSNGWWRSVVRTF
jgi:transcriptional regulator with XRE-family HTH domain